MRRGSHRRPRGPVRPPSDSTVEVVFGVRAGLGVLRARCEDIRAVHYEPEQRRTIAPLLDWAETRGIVATSTNARELERISRSSLHEGVCVTVRPRRFAALKDFSSQLRSTSGVAIALDRIRNPYNVGSILRSAAFFGLEGALFGPLAGEPSIAPDAVRVAEGGAEHLVLARTTDLAGSLSRLASDGVQVVGVESDGREDAATFVYTRPSILVLGHEREGLSPRVRAACSTVVSIAGAGKVDSLNVGVAAALVMAAALGKS